MVEVSHKVGKEKDEETLQGKEYDRDDVQALPVTLCVFWWDWNRNERGDQEVDKFVMRRQCFERFKIFAGKGGKKKPEETNFDKHWHPEQSRTVHEAKEIDRDLGD